ncbi:MAG TPA: flagellar biosynthesis protein FliQ [Spirochaetia bacterium]|nr:flagellar biosynthesis protein FliQ [Spirochaetia bacterium]
MSLGLAINLIRGGVLEILLLSAPILLVGMGVGLIVSIFQATTSLQEQTLTFVPKIAAILGAIILFGPWMFTSLVQFTLRLFERIPDMAG